MPSQQEVRWSQLKVGILVLASLALLVFFLFLLTSAGGVTAFNKPFTAVVYFENAQGLRLGAPVNLQGVAVGEVKRVQISNDPARRLTPVQVLLKLNPKFQASLHTDTRAAIAANGVIGDAMVELNSQTASGPQLQNGDELHTMELPSIASFMKSGQGTLSQLNGVLAKLDKVVDGLAKGTGSAGQLLTNPALYDEANATVAQLHRLTVDLNNGHGSAGKLLTDDSLYNRLNDAAGRLDTLTTNLSTGKGTAGKLLTDDALYNNLNETLTRTNTLLAQVDAGKGSMGLLFKDQGTADRLNDSITQLDTMLRGVNAGKGTVGQLVTNDSAYNNLNKLLIETSTLATMLREDPKKYLTIHMKIF